MKYINAAEILPKQLLKELQTYIEGSVLYVPKVSTKKEWGGIVIESYSGILMPNLQPTPDPVLMEAGFLWSGSIFLQFKYHGGNCYLPKIT